MVGNLVLANAMVKADVRMAFVSVTHSSADKIALKVSKKVFTIRFFFVKTGDAVDCAFFP